MAAQLVVVGGCVMDVQAHPTGGDDVRRGGSVPGHVAQVPGGVARNIAQAATQLLADTPWRVLLLSVLGRDAAGDALLAACRQQGMDTRGLARSDASPTPSVCTVLDRAGEVAASVASVAAVETELTPQRVAGPLAPHIAAARLLVLDSNLTADALSAAAALGAAHGAAVLVEPVSVPKAARCVPALRHVTFITPNAAELAEIGAGARAALGLPPLPASSSSEAGAGAAGPAGPAADAEHLLTRMAPYAAAVLAAGCKCIVLTLGEEGAALITRPAAGQRALSVTHLPALPARPVSLSGAGDCLVAGFAAAKLRGDGDVAALAAGVAAATAAVEAEGNVPAGLGFESVRRRARGLAEQAQTWLLPLQAAL